MKRSAGILLYKKENNRYLVLLAHFGGPYWEKQDKGAWSVQKGIVEKGEKVLSAAKREVAEEAKIPFIYATYGFGAVEKYNNKIDNIYDLLTILKIKNTKNEF